MTQQFQGERGAIYIRGVKRMDRDKFHAACVLRGLTMRTVLTQFIRDFGNNAVKKTRTTKKHSIPKHLKIEDNKERILEMNKRRKKNG